MNQSSLANYYSIEAYRSLDNRITGRLYQQILGILSDDIPKTREEIEQLTGIKGNTLRPRIQELIQWGVLAHAGEGTTASGRKAEKIGILTPK